MASEVRALAQRSAEAAKEIKGLISTSTDQVDVGVDLMAQIGKALRRMVAQSRRDQRRCVVNRYPVSDIQNRIYT